MTELTGEIPMAPPVEKKQALFKGVEVKPKSEHETVSGGEWNHLTREYTVFDPKTDVTTVYRLQLNPKHEGGGRYFVSTEHYKNKKVVVQDVKTHEWRDQRPIDKIRSFFDTMSTRGYIQKNTEPGKKDTFTLVIEKHRNPFRKAR